MKDREAMKLSLEHAKRDERHMNHAETRYWCRMYRDIAENAIEALAEQPAQHKPLSESEERKAFEMYWQAKHDNRRYCESAFEGWKARAAPQPAQQEPVAKDNSNYRLDPPGLDPLYTSPPASKPLTAHQTMSMTFNHHWLTSMTLRDAYRLGIRDAEAAHNIKENT